MFWLACAQSSGTLVSCSKFAASCKAVDYCKRDFPTSFGVACDGCKSAFGKAKFSSSISLNRTFFTSVSSSSSLFWIFFSVDLNSFLLRKVIALTLSLGFATVCDGNRLFTYACKFPRLTSVDEALVCNCFTADSKD